VGTYHNKGIIETITSKWIPVYELVNAYGSEEQALLELRNQATAQLKSQFETAFAQQGATVTVISADITDFHLEKATSNVPLQTPVLQARLHMTVNLTIDSNKPFMQSPLVLWVILAIGIAVAGTAAAITVPAAIADWLKSMTTKTQTFTQETYGWVKNPNTGQYEWKVTNTKTGTTTSPDYGGIGEIGIIAVGGAVVLIVLLFFLNKSKKGGE
jgi:hypothetical protein